MAKNFNNKGGRNKNFKGGGNRPKQKSYLEQQMEQGNSDFIPNQAAAMRREAGKYLRDFVRGNMELNMFHQFLLEHPSVVHAICQYVEEQANECFTLNYSLKYTINNLMAANAPVQPLMVTMQQKYNNKETLYNILYNTFTNYRQTLDMGWLMQGAAQSSPLSRYY